MKKLLIILITFFLHIKVLACEYQYILNDKCINELYSQAQIAIKNKEIKLIRDSRGLILRIKFDDPIEEYFRKNEDVYKEIEYFLAKIENSAIIEVHIENFPSVKLKKLKKWEFSTIMANQIEAFIVTPKGSVNQNRIHSIGYGEFLPEKNTSNNGGKKSNRIDIIVLCNVSGE